MNETVVNIVKDASDRIFSIVEMRGGIISFKDDSIEIYYDSYDNGCCIDELNEIVSDGGNLILLHLREIGSTEFTAEVTLDCLELECLGELVEKLGLGSDILVSVRALRNEVEGLIGKADVTLSNPVCVDAIDGDYNFLGVTVCAIHHGVILDSGGHEWRMHDFRLNTLCTIADVLK